MNTTNFTVEVQSRDLGCWGIEDIQFLLGGFTCLKLVGYSEDGNFGPGWLVSTVGNGAGQDEPVLDFVTEATCHRAAWQQLARLARRTDPVTARADAVLERKGLMYERDSRWPGFDRAMAIDREIAALTALIIRIDDEVQPPAAIPFGTVRVVCSNSLTTMG